jgi:hypothetical protein
LLRFDEAGEEQTRKTERGKRGWLQLWQSVVLAVDFISW